MDSPDLGDVPATMALSTARTATISRKIARAKWAYASDVKTQTRTLLVVTATWVSASTTMGPATCAPTELVFAEGQACRRPKWGELTELRTRREPAGRHSQLQG